MTFGVCVWSRMYRVYRAIEQAHGGQDPRATSHCFVLNQTFGSFMASRVEAVVDSMLFLLHCACCLAHLDHMCGRFVGRLRTRCMPGFACAAVRHTFDISHVRKTCSWKQPHSRPCVLDPWVMERPPEPIEQSHGSSRHGCHRLLSPRVAMFWGVIARFTFLRLSASECNIGFS